MLRRPLLSLLLLTLLSSSCSALFFPEAECGSCELQCEFIELPANATDVDDGEKCEVYAMEHKDGIRLGYCSEDRDFIEVTIKYLA